MYYYSNASPVFKCNCLNFYFIPGADPGFPMGTNPKGAPTYYYFPCNVFTPVCQSFFSQEERSLYDVTSCLAASSHVPRGVCVSGCMFLLGVSVSGPMFLPGGVSLDRDWNAFLFPNFFRTTAWKWRKLDREVQYIIRRCIHRILEAYWAPLAAFWHLNALLFSTLQFSKWYLTCDIVRQGAITACRRSSTLYSTKVISQQPSLKISYYF